MTEALFECLKNEEAFKIPPVHNLRHPMIFYYGHPAALYINKLRVAGLLQQPINPYFEIIFETGVDEMSWCVLTICYSKLYCMSRILLIVTNY